MDSFSFYGPCILEKEHWRKSKIIVINRFKLLYKDRNGRFAQNRAGNRGMTFQKTYQLLNFPARAGSCPALHYHPAPKKSASLVHILCLTGYEWSNYLLIYNEHNYYYGSTNV